MTELSISSELPVLEFDYENHEGIDTHRVVIPIYKTLGFRKKDPYYPKKQLLMEAYDIDKNGMRTFSLHKMRNMELQVVILGERSFLDRDNMLEPSEKIVKGIISFLDFMDR